MFLKKWINIIKILFLFEWKHFLYYPVNQILSILSKTIYVGLNLFFWYVVQNAGFTMEGWSYNEIIVFIAFSELFYGLDDAIFSMSSRFWGCIHRGILDNTLSRPFDPRVRYILLNINYWDLLLTFIEFGVLLAISNVKMHWSGILTGILFVLGAEFVLAFIRLCGSYLAFWHGKMDAACEVMDCLTSFNKYPLTIMPKPIILVIQFIFPFFFFSTFSAEFICFTKSEKELCISVCGFICTIVLWGFLNKILWKKGLQRYESIHG